jgi:hypothetical protein
MRYRVRRYCATPIVVSCVVNIMHPMCRVPLSSIQYTRTRHSVGQSVNYQRNSRRVKDGYFFANGCCLR